MVDYPGGATVFLLVAIATHGVIGYTLGRLLFERPVAGALGGVLPDGDFLFPAVLGPPFVHRGLTHTLLVAGLVIAVVARFDGRVAASTGAGYLSHLFVDATTPAGIPLAYPLTTEHVGIVLHAHAPEASVAIWTACLLLLFLSRRWPIGAVERV